MCVYIKLQITGLAPTPKLFLELMIFDNIGIRLDVTKPRFFNDIRMTYRQLYYCRAHRNRNIDQSETFFK